VHFIGNTLFGLGLNADPLAERLGNLSGWRYITGCVAFAFCLYPKDVLARYSRASNSLLAFPETAESAWIVAFPSDAGSVVAIAQASVSAVPTSELIVSIEQSFRLIRPQFAASVSTLIAKTPSTKQRFCSCPALISVNCLGGTYPMSTLALNRTL
jgi:hypothetical protein